MNSKIETSFKNPFKKFVKKQNKVLQGVIYDEIKKIAENPYIGVKKVGDLSEFFVHKFKYNRQEYLIAYTMLESDIVGSTQRKKIELVEFYSVGAHGNFYRNLRKFIQS